MSSKKILYYDIIIDSNLNISSENFINTVNNILSDKRTWKKYKFINMKNVDDNDKLSPMNIFKIILCSPKIIKKKM